MSPLPPFTRDRCPRCGAPTDACRCGLRDPWPFSDATTIALTFAVLILLIYALIKVALVL